MVQVQALIGDGIWRGLSTTWGLFWESLYGLTPLHRPRMTPVRLDSQVADEPRCTNADILTELAIAFWLSSGSINTVIRH